MESARHRIINFNFNKNSQNIGIGVQSQANAIQATSTAAASGATKAAAATAASTGSFFATKAGIIVISVVATIVVATAVTVPIVLTQNNDDTTTDVPILDTIQNTYIDNTHTDIETSENEESSIEENEIKGENEGDSNKEKETEDTKESEGGSNKENEVENTKENERESNSENESEETKENEKEEEKEEDNEHTEVDPENPVLKDYFSDMISLTQNNFIECSQIITGVERDIPSSTQYFDVNVEISYGGNNNAINDKYEEILEENNKLIASSTTYDKIGADKTLYLNGQDTGKKLFKHIFSVGLYGGEISDSEKAVKKVMKINPVSTTNYITGLYAPPGELIKIEISEGLTPDIREAWPIVNG